MAENASSGRVDITGPFVDLYNRLTGYTFKADLQEAFSMTVQNEEARPRRASHVDEELAIRFVNTVAWRRADEQEERLPSAEALLRWFAEARLFDAGFLRALSLEWKGDPVLAENGYQTALSLRETIYRALQSAASDKAPAKTDLSLLSQLLNAGPPGMQLSVQRGRYLWNADGHANGVCVLLMPVVISALALLTGPHSHKVKQCQDDRGCGWLFVDESRAQNRRWCSMGDCGNRAKARRHYVRQRDADV
jgi:predicted RNA-binding Zn ribbon-like protein